MAMKKKSVKKSAVREHERKEDKLYKKLEHENKKFESKLSRKKKGI